MKIQVIIFTTLIVVTYSSCHPPPRRVLKLQLESICGNHSVAGSDYVAAAHRDSNAILHTRTKCSRSGKVSLSPVSAPPPYIKPENGTNTSTNTSVPIQQPSSKIPFWVPTFEEIITLIFRAVILILTVFNVNITWRIHGQ